MRNWIKSKAHVHMWGPSCWNCYGVAMEETCYLCGAKRHHLDWADSRDNVWRDGPNPVAEQMRQDGVTQNY